MRKRRNFVDNHAKLPELESDDIRTLFKAFVKIKVSEGIAIRTIKQYETNFTQFCDYIETHGGNYGVQAITADFVREWLTHMQQEHVQFRKIAHRKTKSVGLKPATINTRLKTLKVMFNTLHTNLLVKSNPLAKVSNVQQPEELIEVLSDTEITRILSVMDKTYYTSFRDYVLTVLLLDGMLRITEATHLQRNDIDHEKGFVIIRASIAKNRIARMVPVTKRTLRLLTELMKENDFTTSSQYVFATEKGTPYDRNRYNQRLKNYADLAYITKPVHAHIFRHTAATAWLENGGNMEDLRNILGHSKYDMVKRYAHVSNTSIKQSAEQYSVVARMDDI